MENDLIVHTNNDEQFMLTTVDNPYNPFTHFDEWLTFDQQKGYNTLGYLARIAIVSDALSEKDYLLATYEAMKEIVRENVYGVHKMISSKDIKQTTS